MLASVKTLLSSIVDYAGLFPPAKLGMKEAIANYARYQIAYQNWMLGHFVLPASRLKEFEELLPQFSREDRKMRQWSVSAIVSGDWKLEIEKVQSFNGRDKIAIAALEFPPLPPTEIAAVLSHLPAGVDVFFEIPLSANLEAYLAVLQGTTVSAKVRTGGLSADAFPNTDQLCRFMFACAKAQVPFKATAGLHHPLPAKHPLTSEPDSNTVRLEELSVETSRGSRGGRGGRGSRGAGEERISADLNSIESDSLSTEMHGFLNVAISAALVYWQKVTPEEALAVLQESSIKGFQFKADSIVWKDRQLSISEIEKARQHFFRSFGSCSFQEPIDDLKALNLVS